MYLKSKEVLHLTNSDEDTKKSVLKYFEGVIEMDKLSVKSEKGRKIWDDLWEEVRADIKPKKD